MIPKDKGGHPLPPLQFGMNSLVKLQFRTSAEHPSPTPSLTHCWVPGPDPPCGKQARHPLEPSAQSSLEPSAQSLPAGQRPPEALILWLRSPRPMEPWRPRPARREHLGSPSTTPCGPHAPLPVEAPAWPWSGSHAATEACAQGSGVSEQTGQEPGGPKAGASGDVKDWEV